MKVGSAFSGGRRPHGLLRSIPVLSPWFLHEMLKGRTNNQTRYTSIWRGAVQVYGLPYHGRKGIP